MASYTYEFVELGDDEHRLGCKCCRFKKGYDLPIPKSLTEEEIQTLATGLSTSVIKNWTTLNAIVKRFEETIQKRWLKKNDQKRRQILLKAWPDMSPTHRPDFANFRKPGKNEPRSRTRPSAAYLWPHINLEDLQQKSLLLIFINSRARNFPDTFTYLDYSEAHVGEGWSHEVSKTAKTSMQFYGQYSPRMYGKIVDNTSDNKALRHLRMNPIAGLLTLEIQDGVYSFLLKCVQEILHDVDPSLFTLAEVQSQPPLVMQATKAWSSISEFALMKPYQAPQSLDLERIKSWVASRQSSAVDHAWALREDPVCFLNTLKEWKEHDRELSGHGYDCRCNVWGRVAAEMITDAYQILLIYRSIHNILDRMSSLSQILSSDDKKVRLPRSQELACAELSSLLDFFTFKPLERLGVGLPASPRMRGCYRPQKRGDDITNLWCTVRSKTPAEERIDTLFFSLIGAETRQLHGVNRIVQEVQYMLDTDESAGQLVDSWSVDHFSDLALLTEMKTSIDNLYPYSSSWREHKVAASPDVEVRIDIIMSCCDNLSSLAVGACDSSCVLHDPLDGRYDYPADKKATKENINQMRAAEAELDAFWKHVDTYSGAICCTTFQEILKSCQAGSQVKRKLHRTPKWKEPKQLTLSKDVDPVTPLQERSINAFKFYGTGNDAQKHLNIRKTKVKVKTHGLPSPKLPVIVDEEPEPEEESKAREPIPVPKRTFKVMEALLPAPGVENHQRAEVSWDDMCHAFKTIGLEPEKLYGSVWMFKPLPKGQRLVDADRSIQFHEPKDVRKGHKIPCNMVRVLGRRLKHTYGWEGGMFVCA